MLASTLTPRLVVIDYAEFRWEQLEVVLPWLAEQSSNEWPARVLVRVAPRRSDDWTRSEAGDWLDAVLDDVRCGCRTIHRPPRANGRHCSSRRSPRSPPRPPDSAGGCPVGSTY